MPLSSKAVEILKSRQSELKPFGIKRHTLTEAFQRGRVRGGVKHGTFHDGRHSAITRLAKVLTQFELARMVGHKSLSMTLLYYNETAEEIAKKLK